MTSTTLSWEQVNAFRLRRHGLDGVGLVDTPAQAAAAMAGARAQIHPAALPSIMARSRVMKHADMEAAIWKH